MVFFHTIVIQNRQIEKGEDNIVSDNYKLHQLSMNPISLPISY